MKNIAFQQPLFHTRRENNIKEYRDLIDRLELVDQILLSSGIEFAFAEYHLVQVTANGIKRFGNPDFKLNSKQKRHYTLEAIQALRCNFLKHELKRSCRELAFHIAASEDLQLFVFAGDFISAKCPGKTRINNYDKKALINTLNKLIEKLDLEIKKCVAKSDELREDVAYATSIKGIGLKTAASVLAECGRLDNYGSRQLGAYSGLAPFNHRSGTSVNYTHISRQGPKQLRQALYTPMTCLLRHNPEMRAFRQRLIDKGRTPMQARCAVMRKVLILIRALVVNKTFYQENFHKI